MTRQQKWDYRYLALVDLVASWSKDPSTKTGAAIVRPDFTLCSIGYNGFPSAMPDQQENYNNREAKYSRIIHCEMNALLHVRERVAGYTLYTTGCSCDRCFVHMVQAGISRFVFFYRPEMQARWGKQFEAVEEYAKECGVELVKYLREPVHAS